MRAPERPPPFSVGVQALAGHATAAFTLQRYTHHYDASAGRTADAIGTILPDDS